MRTKRVYVAQTGVDTEETHWVDFEAISYSWREAVKAAKLARENANERKRKRCRFEVVRFDLYVENGEDARTVFLREADSGRPLSPIHEWTY